MTPHKGEFARIFENSDDKISDCLKAAKLTNSIILLSKQFSNFDYEQIIIKTIYMT